MEGLLGTTTPLRPPDCHLLHAAQHGFWSRPRIQRHAYPQGEVDADALCQKERSNTSPSDPEGKQRFPHVEHKDFFM